MRFRFPWIVVALLVLPAAVRGSILPDTPLGRRASAYFEAFNSGDEGAMKAFIVANVSPQALADRPAEERLRIYRQMRDEHGTLTPERLVEAGDDHVQVIARNAHGQSLDMTFLFDAAEPHGLLGIRVLDTGPSEERGKSEPRQPMGEDQALGAWRAALDSLARSDRFAGAVLVAKGGRVLFQQAYGEASRPGHVPNRVDTKFNLGSINKLFTQVAIAQLVEQGKVRLDDTIDHYLPDYPKDVARRVTVRQLLDHRGGIGDIFGDAYDRMDRSKLRSVADWIPLFRDTPLAFEPGSQQRYSNGGYVLLGAIVEKASGEDYYGYVRKHVYAPLGMKDTDHYAMGGAIRNLAAGYTRHASEGGHADTSEWVDNAASRPWRGSPAGGGYSTLADLLRFTQALRAGTLLRRATVANGFPMLEAGPKGELGLAAAGGAPGINAAIECVGPYTIIVLANLDPPAATEPARTLARWLPADGPPNEQRLGAASTAVGAGGNPHDLVTGGPGGRHDAPRKTVLPEGPVDVEMLRVDHLPAVRVMLNGKGPFLFGIDTGGGGSARLDSALAARLGLQVVGKARTGDPSGHNVREVDLVEIGALEVGGAHFEGVVAAVRDSREGRLGRDLDGILGFGLFQDALLTLDYPAGRVRIERGELPPPDGADVVPFRMPRGIPEIDLRVDSLTVSADVDAGSMGGFTLPADWIGKLPLASKPQVVGRARTLGNEFEIQAADLAGVVRLGGHAFRQPRLGFQPVFAMANVGDQVLRDFSVTFDQKNLRMRLTRKT